MEQSAKILLKQLGDPAVILDGSGEIHFANSEFRDLVGNDFTTLTRSNIGDTPVLFDDVDDSIEHILESSSEKSCPSVTITPNDGSTEVELSIHPLEGEPLGQYLGIVHEDATTGGERSIEAWSSLMEQLPEITPLVDISCLLTPDHESEQNGENKAGATDNVDEILIDGRFTSEGISVSAYDEDRNLLNETWFTWDEIEAIKSDDESHFTFEFEGLCGNSTDKITYPQEPT